MAVHVNVQVGRNDPCPCGSGKKYKRCCLEQRNASYGLWARQRDASDELTREMMRFAALKFGHQIGEAWQDFHATDLPLPFDERSHANQIFMPYFLFHWDPQRRRSGKGAATKGGIVARWFMPESYRSWSVCFLYKPRCSRLPSSRFFGRIPMNELG